MTRPIVWSISGNDSGGGAGLTADQRAADAMGVHLCPVVAAVTAQNSQAVTGIEPMPVDLIDAQLQALADDMPPAAIKTGLLGGAAQVRVVARWVDRMRQRRPVALVVDPVLGSSTGTPFADTDTLQAYRDELLPRATLVTPNRREAQLLLGEAVDVDAQESVPALALALRRQYAAAVCITGGDSADHAGLVRDWLASEHAEGWLALPRVDTLHHHGTGCTFASSAAAAMALGFVPADAVVLAKMATTHALRHGYAAGAGAGPVCAGSGFEGDPTLLPQMSFGDTPIVPMASGPRPQLHLALYAIVDSADRVEQVLAAGVRSVQLRMKRPGHLDAPWAAQLREAVLRSVAACRAVGAEFFVNDHWELACEAGAGGVHLGQEDLQSLGERGRAALAASGLHVGISTHSLWELCRARSLAPRYIACGPVWPTLTKAMPWRAQGLHNLKWWRDMAGLPVVAIGGILESEQVFQAAKCCVDGVCIVRGLGDDPSVTVGVLGKALEHGWALCHSYVASMPHPSLAWA